MIVFIENGCYCSRNIYNFVCMVFFFSCVALLLMLLSFCVHVSFFRLKYIHTYINYIYCNTLPTTSLLYTTLSFSLSSCRCTAISKNSRCGWCHSVFKPTFNISRNNKCVMDTIFLCVYVCMCFLLLFSRQFGDGQFFIWLTSISADLIWQIRKLFTKRKTFSLLSFWEWFFFRWLLRV